MSVGGAGRAGVLSILDAGADVFEMRVLYELATGEFDNRPLEIRIS